MKKLFVLLILFTVSLNLVYSQSSDRKRPNVILIIDDDHPPQLIGAYGNKLVITPTIDSLAKNGAIFDAAYTASPSCAPARASMMTSNHVSRHEVWDNASPLRSDWPTFAHSFTAAGYRTILCGKMHFVGPDQLHGFQERWMKDVYPATFDWTRLNRDSVAVNTGGQNIKSVYQAREGFPYRWEYDEEVLLKALYGLDKMTRQTPDQPFLLVISFHGPHYPYQAPKKYWDLYEGKDIPLPEIPKNYLTTEAPHVKWLRKSMLLDHIVPDSVYTAARRAYLGRITMIDDYMAKVLNKVNELSLDNTIVSFTSDHGDMLGEKGLWFKDNPYEWSSRVPWVITGPNIPAQRISEVTSHVDLGPTLCSLAGVKFLNPHPDGRNLSDLVYGKRPSGEGLAIMENYNEGVWKGYRMVRKGKYKLVHIPKISTELYDIENDPGEWNNLASNKKYTKIRKELEAIAMDGWDPERLNEVRYRSEERRMVIKESGTKPEWEYDETKAEIFKGW